MNRILFLSLICVLFITGCNSDMINDAVNASMDPRVPEINIKQGQNEIISGSSYDFGGVEINRISQIVNFTIENLGTTDLKLEGNPMISITGDDADMFILTGYPASNIIPAGRNETFSMLFNPLSLNQKNAVITILNNDSDENVFMFSLSGNTPPVADFSARMRSGILPVTVNFINITRGGAIEWAWDFNNDGQTDAISKEPSYTFNNPGAFSIKLTATGPGGNHIISKSMYIEVMPSLQNIIDTDYVYSKDMTVADIDNDGNIDIVAVNSEVGGFTWWENVDAAGTSWLENRVTHDDIDVNCIQSADISGDSAADVIVSTSEKIIWWKNNGSGGFTVQTLIQDHAGCKGTWFITVDLNKTNGYDILAKREKDLVLYVNNGSGSFSAGTVIESNISNFYEYYSADINGDTWPDVLLNKNGNIFWWRNNGSGYLEDPDGGGDGEQLFENTIGTTIACDIDNDSYIDIMGTKAWLMNDGSMNFTRQTYTGYDLENISEINAKDVDDDGYIDIIARYRSDNFISWWKNDGSAVPFFSENIVATRIDTPIAIEFADINGDGHNDFIAAAEGTPPSYNSGGIFWWDIYADIWPVHKIETFFDGAEGAYAADFNNDGYIDIAAGADALDTVKFWDNYTGTGLAWYSSIIDSDFNVNLNFHSPDINNDGYPDLIAATADDQTVTYWINNGDNTFTTGTGIQNSLSLVQAKVVCAADLTGNGYQDIIAGSNLLNGVSPEGLLWWENNGNLDFNNYVEIDKTIPVDALNAADLNNDGKIDIIAGSEYSAADKFRGIAWYENEGDGVFSARKVFVNGSSFTPPWRCTSVQSADVDGDDNPDIIACSYAGNISWFKNNGDETFGGQNIIIEKGCERGMIKICDLDNDGDNDIISAGQYLTDEIAFWENNGAGIFAKHFILSIDDANSVQIADMDGDGDYDIIASSNKTDEVFWIENNLVKWGK